jgi:hypothetical protein
LPRKEKEMARKFEERTSKPANDAYTGMLALSFLALLIGSTFLYIQYSQYGDTAPTLHRKIEKDAGPPPEVGDKGDKGDKKEPKDDTGEEKKDDKKADGNASRRNSVSCLAFARNRCMG